MTDVRGRAGDSADAIARRDRERASALLRRAERFERGAEGERHVAALLASLPEGFYVLHDLDLPASAANVDHLVIGPPGVTVVDAKAYSGRLTAGGGTLWRGRHSLRRECATTRWEADRLAEHLRVPVAAVLCFVGTELPAAVVRTDEAVACRPDGLLDLLRSGQTVLDPIRCRELASSASSLLRHRSAAGWPPPAQQQSPPSAPAATERRKKLRPVWRIAAVVAALVFLGPAMRVASQLIGSAARSAMPDVELSPVTTADTSAAETTAETGSTTTSTVEPRAAPQIDAPPTLAIECVRSGQGWTVSIVATQYVQDEQGYHTWYRVGGPASPWSYAGMFRSGLDGPPSLGGVDSNTSIELRYDRGGMTTDPETSEGYASFSTGAAC